MSTPPAAAPAMTKTRAHALARRARATHGHFRTSPTTIELFCPLDTGHGRLAHRVTVWHQVWETPTAAQIDAAFIEHYTAPYDEDRCHHVPANTPRVVTHDG
jgi:hypothetical protein